MRPKKRQRTQSRVGTKRKKAKQLMKGDGVEQDEAKAVSLLEDCVAHGDADSMMVLAKCCALGCGMEYNAKRAEALVSEAANKGNAEAQNMMEHITVCKGEESSLDCLLSIIFDKASFIHKCLLLDEFHKELHTFSVPILMNIVPCKSIIFRGQG